MIPRTGRADTLRGVATVTTAGGHHASVPIVIAVGPTVVVNHGDNEPWRLSRLRWLNSQLGATGPPPAPYTAVTRVGRSYHILGRTITIAPNGLPAQVSSAFTADGALSAARREMLAAPVTLDVVGADGSVVPWRPLGEHPLLSSTARAAFTAHSRQGSLNLDVHGQLDFDGNLEYRVALVSRADVPVQDVRLTVPFVGSVARFFMGLNQKGGNAPAQYDWHWDVTRNQDAVWIGDVNARAAVHPQGRTLRSSAQHQLLPAITAGDAAVVVE